MTYFGTRSLRREFGGVVALQDASFEIAQGDITGLIGPNGSGKTTLFNLITGMIPTHAGEILFRDRNIAGLRPHRIARLGIGRTFQVTRVFGRMTALENMLVGVGRRGFAELTRSAVRGEEVDRALRWLARVGLERHSAQQAWRLSYGQQKLLEFAGVMMLEPELILLDEPAGGVNPVMIERMATLIRELNGEGHTFLVVEHNMEFVMNLCDQVVVLDRGSPLVSGPPEEVRNDRRVLEAYLGV